MRARASFGLLLLFALGVLLYGLMRGPDVDAIADDLPLYPGARLLARSSERYDDWSRDVFLTYEVPKGTTGREVDAFYRERMDDSWGRPDADCEGFTRDGALVMAGVDVFDATVLKVLVAPDGAEACEERSSFLHS